MDRIAAEGISSDHPVHPEHPCSAVEKQRCSANAGRGWPPRRDRPGLGPAPLFATLLSAAVLAACSKKPPPPARPETPHLNAVVVIAGYEPFAGLQKNTSWEVAKKLDGGSVAGLTVVAVRLPVVWEECGKRIRKAIREHRPRAVLATGVAWRGLVQIETVARNERRSYKDNRKELPRAKEIEPGGPALVETRLPVPRIVKRLEAMGLPVALSNDAGGYLCNEGFYSVLRETARLETETGERVPAGFVHLPRAGPDRAKAPRAAEKKVRAVTVDELAAGMRAAIEEMVRAGLRRRDRGERGERQEHGQRQRPRLLLPQSP